MDVQTTCNVDEIYEYPGEHAPQMECVKSPAFQNQCKQSPETDYYVGYWDSSFKRVSQTYRLFFAFAKDLWKRLKEGKMSPSKNFRESSASIFWPRSLGRGDEALTAWAEHIEEVRAIMIILTSSPFATPRRTTCRYTARREKRQHG
eukprot:1092158-Rhodomonas_salina.1